MKSKKKYNKKYIDRLPMEEKIKKIYELYPDYEAPIKNWDKGGFVDDNKYKQPIKHRK